MMHNWYKTGSFKLYPYAQRGPNAHKFLLSAEPHGLLVALMSTCHEILCRCVCSLLVFLSLLSIRARIKSLVKCKHTAVFSQRFQIPLQNVEGSCCIIVFELWWSWNCTLMSNSPWSSFFILKRQFWWLFEEDFTSNPSWRPRRFVTSKAV